MIPSQRNLQVEKNFLGRICSRRNFHLSWNLFEGNFLFSLFIITLDFISQINSIINFKRFRRRRTLCLSEFWNFPSFSFFDEFPWKYYYSIFQLNLIMKNVHTLSGWKDQILSLPKRWLSQQSTDTDEFGFPVVSKEMNFILSHETWDMKSWFITHRNKFLHSNKIDFMLLSLATNSHHHHHLTSFDEWRREFSGKLEFK